MFMNVIECLRVVREHSRTFEIINDVRRRSETFRDDQKMTIWLSDIVCINKLCILNSILDQIGLVQEDHERQPPPEIPLENNPMPRPGIRAAFNE